MDDLNPFAEAILLQPLRLYQMIYRCICVCMSLGLIPLPDLLGLQVVMLTKVVSPHIYLLHSSHMEREP